MGRVSKHFTTQYPVKKAIEKNPYILYTTPVMERSFLMKGVITVLGKDQVGIIASVCSYLSNEGINILDISQSIVQGFFNMIMVVDVTNTGKPFEQMVNELRELGETIGVQIKIQHEDIFNGMHRI
jgi:ACT domain-containing protein